MPHISQWFTEKLNERHLVAVSVPIFDESDNVMGVLGRTIEIRSLLDVYSHAIFAEAHPGSTVPDDTREIALIERARGNVLDHTWFDKHHEDLRQQTLKPAELESFRVSEAVRDKLQRLARTDAPLGKPDSDVDDHYTDPLSRLDVASKDLEGDWLAAFAAVPWTDWVAVVQERRTAALEPVQEMKSRLTRTGLWALVGSCGLIGLLWYFVGRALIDRTPRFWPLRPKTATGRGQQRSSDAERILARNLGQIVRFGFPPLAPTEGIWNCPSSSLRVWIALISGARFWRPLGPTSLAATGRQTWRCPGTRTSRAATRG